MSERRIRRLKNAGLIVVGGVLGVVLTVTVGVAAWWPRSAVVYRDRQPSTVDYPDGSRHYLGLVRDRSPLSGDSFHLMIGRDPGLSYGHRVRVDTATTVAVGRPSGRPPAASSTSPPATTSAWTTPSPSHLIGTIRPRSDPALQILDQSTRPAEHSP